MERTVVVRVLLHLGKSPHPSRFSCGEGLVTRMGMPALSNSPCFPGKPKPSRHPELWPQASCLLAGVGRTHFKEWKLQHPRGFPFGSRWRLCGFRTKSSIFACRKLRDQLSNVIQARGEALKVKKGTLYLMHSAVVLSEAICAKWSSDTARWEHWPRTSGYSRLYLCYTVGHHCY